MPSAALLALLAGAAIAFQNAVMVAMTGSGVSLTGALLVNSAVGLVILGSAEVLRAGPGFALEIAERARLWFLVPGLLGTFFVFASLYGYRCQGAAATIVLIVAAQLVTGLALDMAGLCGITRVLTLERGLGVALVAAGAFLVVRQG